MGLQEAIRLVTRKEKGVNRREETRANKTEEVSEKYKKVEKRKVPSEEELKRPMSFKVHERSKVIFVVLKGSRHLQFQ